MEAVNWQVFMLFAVASSV